MATSTCNGSLDFCAVRVALLTEAGAPDTGADNGYVTTSQQKMEVTVETEAGRDLSQRNGCGALLNAFREPDKIKSLSLAVDYCQLDAILLEIKTGAETFLDGTDAVGSQFPAVGSSPPPVCFEGWTKAWDGSNQLSHDFTNPNETYIHWVFPFTRWTQGSLTMEGDLQIVPVTGVGSENANITANGPFDDWPTVVANRGGITRLGGWFFDDALPTADCESIEVTSSAS